MQGVAKGAGEIAKSTEGLSKGFTVAVDWMKNLWDKIDVKGWAQSIGGGSAEAVEAAIYFGSGFAIGFLFKKYFRFLITCLLVSIILIKILEYNMILEIDWEGLNVFLGFDSTADFNTILNDSFAWIKANLIVFVSSVVGFLVGYKLG